MPDVFLTGGTGFVGGALLSALCTPDHTVAALARTGDGRDRVAALGAAPIEGDLFDGEALRRGMEGCGVVYHVAGVNGMCLPDPAPMYRANVDGAVGVIRAAADAGVPRVIHTSSAGTIGEPRGTVATADTPHRGSYLTHYERSKALGEQAVLAEGARLGVEVVSVNPASVQGPGRTGGTARILLGYLTGRLRWAVDTTLSLVFVDDCTAAHRAAAGRGVPGRRYLVSGITLSVAEAAALLAEITGERHRIRYLPDWLAGGAAALIGGGYRLLRRQAPFCPEMARTMTHGTRYDGSRAAADLRFAYTPPGEWLRTTVDWYRAEGLI